jgi:hypothetical protein
MGVRVPPGKDDSHETSTRRFISRHLVICTVCGTLKLDPTITSDEINTRRKRTRSRPKQSRRKTETICFVLNFVHIDGCRVPTADSVR